MLDALYRSTPRDGEEFQGAYKPAGPFKHGEYVKVADYAPNSDGHRVEVFECRMPARFFKLVVHERTDHRGKTYPGYTMGTGSGEGGLVHTVASAIAGAMLGLNSPGERH